ncbi:MAG: excinuclease ABC subunit C [Acidobacteriaceae bacterium]
MDSFANAGALQQVGSLLPNSIVFDAARPAWDKIPAAPGVFALFAADLTAEPYISRTPNLRRRIRRLLDPGHRDSSAQIRASESDVGGLSPNAKFSKRLQLAGRVARMEYALTASDFEALLCLYQASCSAFGDRTRKRLHLRPPSLLRLTVENAYPRVYPTSHLTKSAKDDLYGPFPSRGAAEKFLEDMLDLFKLRRCHDELHPDPAFPGCVYSEMKKCLAPCFKGCTDERYAEEAAAVRSFLRTRGASLVDALRHERESASALLEFEKAAELHTRVARAESVAAEVPEAVRPLAHLDAVIVQPAAEPEHVALFRLAQGWLRGPAFYSVAGMRHPNEAAGSTSLFAQPVGMMEAVPITGAPVTMASRDELEQRLEQLFTAIAPSPEPRRRRRAAHDAARHGALADHLCLFARWYYRPLAKRTGEIVFAAEDGSIALKPVLRAISRVYRAAQGVTPPDGPARAG